MSTTGLTAQALGDKNPIFSQHVLQRGLLIALAIGALCILLQPLVASIASSMFSAALEVEHGARRYYAYRTFGFPALFGVNVVTGWLIAHGRSKAVLGQQLVLSVTNIVLDLLLVLGLKAGLEGVALATSIAQWTTLGMGLIRVHGILAEDGLRLWSRPAAISAAGLRSYLTLNLDLVLRTWAMLFAFSWFADAGARAGSAALAANHVLLQVITFWAFVLDAFAYVAEAEVGRAVGARDRHGFDRMLRQVLEVSLAFGLLFGVLTLLFGQPVLHTLVADPLVERAMDRSLVWCALIPFLGSVAWALDGVFIGSTAGGAMRAAAIEAVLAYIATDLSLRAWLGPTSVWPALAAYYVYRGTSLFRRLPALTKRLGP